MFVAPKGRILLSADYSQIDLRVMAHFSKDKLMVEDFERGADFHRSTAARMLDKPEDKVTKRDRRIAKMINFGVLYGLSAFGLSESLGIEREEAGEYIKEYFEKYEGVREWIENTIAHSRKEGWVETPLGRRRYIGSLKSNNQVVRAAAEREAINLPIQGGSADIMRIAMDDLYEEVVGRKNVDLVLQIHDEFLFECDEGVVEEFAEVVKERMGRAVTLRVPLECSTEVGRSLADMEEV